MTDAPQPGPMPMYPTADAPPPRKSNTLKIVLIVIAACIVAMVLLIGGCFLLVNNATKDAQKVSDDFVAAVQAGDGAKAYSYTSPAFREATTQDQLDQLVQELSKLVGKDKASPNGKGINSSTDNGTIAVFTYKLGPLYFKTQIRDEDDGGWKVMNFRSSRKALDTTIE